MKILIITCFLCLCFAPIHSAKRGLPMPPDKYKMLLEPNDYYQSDEPQTDGAPIEHDTEPSVHMVREFCFMPSILFIFSDFFSGLQIEPRPQELPINQYVNPWGGPFFPSNPWNPYGPPPPPDQPSFIPPPFGAPNGPPPFRLPVDGPPPIGPPPLGPSPLGPGPLGPGPLGPGPFGPGPFVPSPFGPPPFGPPLPVQTEYGIFVPDGHHHNHHQNSHDDDDSTEMSDMLKDLVPRSVVYMLSKWSAFIVSVFSVVAFGGIVTTAICSLTPLCTITFASLPMAALRNSIAGNHNGTNTIERVRRAVQFVSSAIEKFEKLQQSATPSASQSAHN